MENLKEILQLEENVETKELIEKLKTGRLEEIPSVEDAEKAVDPTKHAIFDIAERPDKQVKTIADEKKPDEYTTKTVKVARTALSLQKLIIRRAVAFLFGNPVVLNADTDKDENKEKVLKALERVLYDVKSTSLNRKVARLTFTYREAAELWHVVEKENSDYGFPSKFKLRCKALSPGLGDALYPYFDEFGDMVAFSREFKVKKNDEEIKFFETYTAERHFLWKEASSNYVIEEGYPKENAIGKIPIIYAYQDYFETQDVDNLIDRLEKLLSNFADTNDYHSSPTLFAKGTLLGFSNKGETGKIIEGEGENADLKYVSWDQAPESIKLEIVTLIDLIYTLSQTPDISFSSVKGLGALSGVALKLLFTDAHLKVQDKREIFDEYMQRRVNVIKSFIAQFSLDLKEAAEELIVEPEITPYSITNEKDVVDMLYTATGGKPIVSQKEASRLSGLSANPEKDYEQMQEEANAENLIDITEQGV